MQEPIDVQESDLHESDSVTVTLSDEAYQALREIQELRGGDLVDALKAALASERLILREAKNGSTILIKNRAGTREITPSYA